MENDELEACKEALDDIIAACDSHRGLVEKYKDEGQGEEQGEHDAALVVEVGEAPESAAEEAAEPMADEQDEGPPPISIIDRPGAKIPPKVKRGPGRPRKGGY